MKQIKLWLVVLLFSSLFACASTPKEAAKEQNDKKAARLNVQLASGYIQRGDLKIAQEKLEKAILFDDTYVQGFTTLAVLMNKLGKTERAEKLYLIALDLDGEDPNLQNNYGTFLCGIGKYKEAVEVFEKTLTNQFYKTPGLVHGNIGYCLSKAKDPDYKKIEKHLRAALKLHPNMTSAMLGMAELSIKTKKYLTARAYSQRYHALMPPSAESLWIQAQAEYALGDKKYFLKISETLLERYPKSEQAKKLMELSAL